MDSPQIEARLNRKPFVPFRIHMLNGDVFEVPFRHVIVLQKSRLILFKGVKKEGSHAATGFDLLPYQEIDRIDDRPGQSRGRRKKAS